MTLSPLWSLVKEHYHVKKPLGKGSYGDVMLCKCLKTQKKYAIKLIKNFANHDYGCVKVIREI